LNKEKIDFLIRNKIKITISLDGSEKIHNRYRVFKNGKGTFLIIFNNLSNIKKYSNDYFSKYVSINAVLAPPYDIEDTISFFYKNPILKKIGGRIKISFVDSYETTFFKDFNLEDNEKNKYKKFIKLRSNFNKSLIEGTYNSLTIEKELFRRSFYDIHTRIMEPLGVLYPPQGTCYIGQRKTFVDVNGKIYMCEKVGNNYEIGNVYSGFDYERIYNFYKKYEKFFRDCNDCWALRLCKKCFNNIRKEDEFNEQRKKEMCGSRLNIFEKSLESYCEIRKKIIMHSPYLKI
jgi:uncharacterized protein